MKEIGGYFELYLSKKINNIPSEVLALNTARNSLRYIIKAYKIKEIFVPFYTCPSVWNAIKKENCEIKYYHIDNNFLPIEEFEKNSFILYTNYFGICSKNIETLSKKYNNLIIDNSQAFYMPEYGIASFNSLRKFFGVPDGSFLYCNKRINIPLDKDESYSRFNHLLKRLDISAPFGYKDFSQNDINLSNEEIKLMSNLTKSIYETINLNFIKEQRIKNFNFIHNKLKNKNKLTIKLTSLDVPLIYPFLQNDKNLRKKLIDNKIYVAKYWGNSLKEGAEFDLQENLIPIPIDQRYDESDMAHIIDIINNS